MQQLADRRPRQGTKVTEVDLNAFDLIMEYGYGVKSNLEVANLLGCGEGTISRLRNGLQKAGNSLISCVGGIVTRDEFFQIFVFRGAAGKVPVAA